jgi:signal transduction histidine kinase
MRQLHVEAATRSLILEAANRVALDILTSQTGAEALRHIAEAARQLTHARYAALGVARPDGTGLQEFVTVGLTPEEEARIGPRPQGNGLLGLLLQRSEPLRVDTLAEHTVSSGFPPNHPPMDSFLGVPIRRGDIVLGSLYLTNKENGGSFVEADELAVQALGAYAAVAIHNWNLLSRQRALLRGLILGQEEERRTVAYDLHDGLTQYVMASHAHLETAWRVQEAGDHEKAVREMTKGMSYLQHAVVESRRLVNGLRSLTLDELGLAGALEQLLQEEKMRAGWEETQFVHNIDQVRFDITLETTAYRVAQEALNNARKHARTNRLHLILLLRAEPSLEKEALQLEIRDWGVGFIPEEKLQQTDRVGLHSMSERVSLLGGTYKLESALGKGTLIRAEFPALKRNDDEFQGIVK